MRRYIKLYGERNSGTNYLSRLMAQNLDIPQLRGVVPDYVGIMQRLLPGREWLCDLYFSLTRRSNLGWKHTRAESSDVESARGVCFVTITKNPYAWLLSMHRRPHHQHYAGKPDFEAFLQSPWRTVRRDNCGGTLANPVELWNVKNRSYHQLRKSNGLNITIESLLMSPEQTIAMIGNHFAIGRCSESFVNHVASTSEAGKDFGYYQDFYLNERWREELTDEAIAIINRSLDRQMMDAFGYEVL